MITLHRLLFHDLFFLEALLLDLPLASSFILLHSDADLASVLFLLKLFQSLLFSFSSLLQLQLLHTSLGLLSLLLKLVFTLLFQSFIRLSDFDHLLCFELGLSLRFKVFLSTPQFKLLQLFLSGFFLPFELHSRLIQYHFLLTFGLLDLLFLLQSFLLCLPFGVFSLLLQDTLTLLISTLHLLSTNLNFPLLFQQSLLLLLLESFLCCFSFLFSQLNFPQTFGLFFSVFLGCHSIFKFGLLSGCSDHLCFTFGDLLTFGLLLRDFLLSETFLFLSCELTLVLLHLFELYFFLVSLFDLLAREFGTKHFFYLELSFYFHSFKRLFFHFDHG